MSNPLPPDVIPASKKKSPWLYLGIGCLGILILSVIGITVIGWSAKKVSEMGKDAMSNPDKFAAELIIKANPELELVTSDPRTGQMTIREKSTGKETTFSYKDIATGKFTIKQDGKVVTVDASQTGKTGSVTIKEGDKTTTIGGGGGVDKLPDWIPVYPGWTISSDGGFHMKSGEDTTGSVAGTTTDTVTKVSGYYKDTLEKAGFKCDEMNTSVGDVEMSSVTAKNESLGLEITVSVQKDKTQPEASVTLVYQSKKP